MASMYGLRPPNSALDIAVGPAELAVEPGAHGLGEELRRLPQHVEARSVDDLEVAVVDARDRDAAEHELGVEPVAAFLEVTAVRHLRHHVGGAEQVAHLAVTRVVEPDLLERHLVAGEVDDLRRHRHPLRPGRSSAGSARGTARRG